MERLASHRISVSSRLRLGSGKGRGNSKRARGQGEVESSCLPDITDVFDHELSAGVFALHKTKIVNTPAWKVTGFTNLHSSGKVET